MIPYEVLNSITNYAAPPGKNWYVSGLVRTQLTVETAIAIHDHLLKMRASHPLLGEFVMIWEYYPMAEKVMSVDPDAMAFRMRTPDLACLLSLKWDGDVKDETVKAKAKELVTEHRIFCEKLIQAQPGCPQRAQGDKGVAYGNYGKLINLLKRVPTIDMRLIEMADGRAAALFGTNYSKLQRIKAKYDPHSVFSKWYPIQPSAFESWS